MPLQKNYDLEKIYEMLCVFKCFQIQVNVDT